MKIPADQLKAFIEDEIAFIKRMGIKLTDLKDGAIKLTAPIKGNENHMGTMYAGALFSIAEFVGGPFCWSSFDQDRFYPIVKEMSISYQRPARTDVTVELNMAKDEVMRIESEASVKGKSEFILKTQVKDTSGQTVASTRGVYQLRIKNI